MKTFDDARVMSSFHCSPIAGFGEQMLTEIIDERLGWARAEAAIVASPHCISVKSGGASPSINPFSFNVCLPFPAQ
jgi:hypothetical protein